MQTSGELASGYNRALSNPQGVFKDIAFLAVRRLQGTDAAKRLAQPDIDIDIGTLPGIFRAIGRSSELAQRGHPEIAQAIADAQRQMFARPEQYELALTKTGVDPEVAHRMAADERSLRGTLGAEVRTGPGLADDELRRKAEAKVQTPEGEAIYQRAVRPEVQEVQYGDMTGAQKKLDEIGNNIDKRMIAGWDSLTQAVLNVLEKGDITAMHNPQPVRGTP